jgi:hypothetical protein
MPTLAIIGRLKKTGVILILFVLCAACTVRADQQFVLTVGETMVIPCLIEVWSDQSVNCVISNPEVLMSDGSGRAVIALSEGVSDVYVHMTNPDTDVRYSFVVEPAQHWDAAEGWTQPDETGTDGGTLEIDEPRVNDETPGISPGSRTKAHMPEDGHADSGAEAHMPEDDYADLGVDTDMSKTVEKDALGTTESVPFWEERGSGGISFVVIEDDLPGRTAKEGDVIDSGGVKYRPIAYLNADGEVVPLFVCAAGHEVRWKYIGRILYIEASLSNTGPFRVSARDCRGNICYYSS